MTQPLSPQQQIALLAAYQQQLKAVRATTGGAIGSLWRGLGSWRALDVKKFAVQAAQISQAGQRQTATVTGLMLAEQMGRAPGRIKTSKLSGAALRNGTLPTTVYARPGHLLWRELGRDVPFPQALESSAGRAELLAATDMQLAKTHAAQDAISNSDVTHYRRVLTGASSCALCVVASTHRYESADLLPIHPGCDCTVMPIIGDDTFHAEDDQRLEDAHDLIESTFGVSSRAARTPDYRKLLITHDHGELGPVIAIRGSEFLGPKQIAA